MLKEHEVEIGGRRYKLRQLPAGTARRLLVRIFKMLGPAVTRLIGDGGLDKINGTDLSDAVAMAADKITVDEFESVTAELLYGGQSEAQIEGKFVPLSDDLVNLHFAGRLDDQFRLIGEALRFNYAGFLGGIQRAAAVGAQATAKTG